MVAWRLVFPEILAYFPTLYHKLHVICDTKTSSGLMPGTQKRGDRYLLPCCQFSRGASQLHAAQKIIKIC